jgi:hypothetical protein
MTQKIIKEAGVLRTRLESGSLNIPELLSFLKRVECEDGEVKKVEKQLRKKYSMESMLATIERGHRRGHQS